MAVRKFGGRPMVFYLYRPDWTGQDLISFVDKDPNHLQGAIDRARSGVPGQQLTGTHRGTGEVRTIDLSGEPSAGWQILTDRALNERGIF